MKKLLLAAFLSLGAVSAHADEHHVLGPDTTMVLGYKLWVNEWHTVTPNFAGGFNSIATQGVLSIPSLSLKHKNFFTSISHAVSGKYPFPYFTERNTVGAQVAENVEASRHETDFNVGWYVIPNLMVSMGYKNVEQHYDQTSSVGTFKGTSTSKTHYNGVTFGVGAAAPIGHGWSIYGNGVGGFMDVTYTPSELEHDFANYVGSELGFAWKPQDVPVSLSIGYKYQVINTHVDRLNSKVVDNQTAVDMTQGYILGVNYLF